MKNIVIAVDGTTASGKGTVAKKISKHFNIPYLNTGGLYRAVALYIIKNKIDYNLKNENVINILDKVDFSNLDNEELYFEEVGFVASQISPIKEVRSFLLKFQKDFADKGGVLDGRDIGTVICPNADYKFFITATLEERAKRRYKEMLEKNKNISYEEIFNQIKNRDKKDYERENSPLKKADDAVEIDTTNLSKEEVFKKVLSYIKILQTN